MENKGKRRYEPLSDSVFTYLFSDESTKLSMQEIINGVLECAGDQPIRTIVSVDTQLAVIGETIGSRGGRLDVRALSDDGTIFDIEVQLARQLYMNDRSWFYGGRALGQAFLEGEDYSGMPRIRVINLLDFVLRKSHPDYLQPIEFMYKKCPAETATDAFRIYNVELPKFRKEFPTMASAMTNPLASWLYMLDAGYKKKDEMEVLTNMTEGMKRFALKYNRSLDDPMLDKLYEYELSARRDNNAVLETARIESRMEGKAEGRAEGKAEGRAEGEAKTRESIIRGMLDNGATPDFIYKCVDVSRDEVDAIISRLRAG